MPTRRGCGMPKLPLTLLWLIFAAALSSCATNGAAVRPGLVAPCPVLPPLPAALLTPSSAGKQVRAQLFVPLTSVTRR